LVHRFVAAPRNTESIPSSPRLALGQKSGDFRDPDDASVNHSLRTVSRKNETRSAKDAERAYEIS
jgi:hypothetical protein